jgi:hypothetical protein
MQSLQTAACRLGSEQKALARADVAPAAVSRSPVSSSSAAESGHEPVPIRRAAMVA